MQGYDLVRTALAVRKYQDKPLPAEVARRIVEAAWLTGSSMNKQPWHFIAIDDRETLRQIGALAKTGPYIAQAPFAVAVLTEGQGGAVSDASRAIQSMILAAWSEGVGSNWVGYFGLDDIKPLLGVPQGLELFAIVPFGYPLEKLGRGKKKRKPFDEVVSKGRFGGKF
jgi:nitroreductase